MHTVVLTCVAFNADDVAGSNARPSLPNGHRRARGTLAKSEPRSGGRGLRPVQGRAAVVVVVVGSAAMTRRRR